MLSFVPSLEESDAALWGEQGKSMQALRTALLVVPLEAKTLHGEQFHLHRSGQFTIIADPLGRLQRLYGARALLSHGRARTFLIDPEGYLRVHILHSISERGMGVVLELLQAYHSEGFRPDHGYFLSM